MVHSNYGISQQFESKRNIPRKILYIQGSRLFGIFFHTEMSFIELNLWVCPNALLSQTQAEYHPLIFAEFSSITISCPLYAAARRCYASLDPRLAGILLPDGLISPREFRSTTFWDTFVNPLWDKIIDAVDRSWNDARYQLQTLPTTQELENSASVVTPPISSRKKSLVYLDSP